jgi:hypothetical protein
VLQAPAVALFLAGVLVQGAGLLPLHDRGRRVVVEDGRYAA